MVDRVVCLVYMVALLVGCLGNSVLKVDISEAVEKKRETSGFVLKVIIGGFLCVSVPCTFQLSCGTISNI